MNNAWPQTIEKQNVFSVLTLNIIRFTNWPDPPHLKKINFTLCVYGDNTIQQSFQNISDKQAHNSTVRILSVSRLRLRNLKQCQAIYISGLDKNKLASLLYTLQNQAILTIGDNLKFLQAGGMVKLEDINGKIQLSINLPIVKQSKLVISSRLLKLAQIMDYPYVD